MVPVSYKSRGRGLHSDSLERLIVAHGLRPDPTGNVILRVSRLGAKKDFPASALTVALDLVECKDDWISRCAIREIDRMLETFKREALHD